MPHAEAILTALQRARQDVSVSADHALQLSIAATANVWDAFLLQGFINIQRALPGLSWRAESMGKDQIARQVLERHLDLAILFDAPKIDEMQIDKLGDIKLLPVTTFASNGIEAIKCRDREECLAAGMDDHVTKPIRVDALVEALNQVVARQQITN